MKEIEDSFVAAGGTIRDAIETIERSRAKVALVVDAERRLLGTVTDGDIRRAVLKGIALDAPVSTAMNATPRVAHIGEDHTPYLQMMRDNICRHVPVVDDDGRVVALETLQEALKTPDRDNWVLIMAGGEGKRLRPLTEACPKPMLTVGGQPILEMILDNLKTSGFRNFYISINYLGDIIQEHFGDGSDFGVRIHYLQETEQMGTAGALSLLPARPNETLVVVNGDILTKVDFGHLLDFHLEHDATATMCVRSYIVEVPFGVVELDHHRIIEIQEKPSQNFLINAGIYVLEPEALDYVRAHEPLDMPVLFARMMADNRETSAFPIREYWMDIGRIDDFHKANDEHPRVFLSTPATETVDD